MERAVMTTTGFAGHLHRRHGQLRVHGTQRQLRLHGPREDKAATSGGVTIPTTACQLTTTTSGMGRECSYGNAKAAVGSISSSTTPGRPACSGRRRPASTASLSMATKTRMEAQLLLSFGSVTRTTRRSTGFASGWMDHAV